ncbi:MAG TPA: UDP-N-acetylmuramoyl-tripeptide--D-alanyl-D-alanine ligase [Gammaproteobacteria bacterium]|nr:UDP-N-acetylmuramoyl-tripeptide--D-alanyl-D-alanine ligase [Gammaproteobacteria bacterium]
MVSIEDKTAAPRKDEVWTVDWVARSTDVQIVGGGLHDQFEAIETDSRSLSSSSVFVALKGERFDGHDYVQKAFETGAVAALVSHEAFNRNPDWKELGTLLCCDDPLRAYGDLAAAWRRERALPVVAITGSNGKTSLKELVSAGLGTRGEVHKTPGNFNNLIGTPKTLLDWRGDEWAAVVEVGMNEPGELDRLGEIVAPNVAVINNVSAAHLELLKTIEGVAKAKGELFGRLPDNGIAVYNFDDLMVRTVSLKELKGQRRISFGRNEGATVRLRSFQVTPSGTKFELKVDGTPFTGSIPVFGEFQAMNAAAAVAVGLALGIPVVDMLDGLKNVELPGGRMRQSTAKSGFTIVDDAYNANPGSVAASVTTMSQLCADGSWSVILGDMLELGDKAVTYHREIGRITAGSGAVEVWSVGEFAEVVAEGARSQGARVQTFKTTDDAVEAVRDGKRPAGDCVLLKGSRGNRLERLVPELEAL